MQSGDILMFKGSSWVARMIRWGTESKYSHVAVCVSPDMSLLIESYPGQGVRGADIRKIVEGDYDVYRVMAEHSYDIDGVISYLVGGLNKKYDWRSVCYLGLLKVLSKMWMIPMWILAAHRKDKDYFCSELVYSAFLSGGGLNIVPKKIDSEKVTPEDIAASDMVKLIEEG